MKNINDAQWLNERKIKWKNVKFSLKNYMQYIDRIDHQYLKEYFLTGQTRELNISDYQPLVNDYVGSNFFTYHLLVNFWLNPDQSEGRWNSVWYSMAKNYPLTRCVGSYQKNRERFFESASQGGVYNEYGAYGGLEERMVKYFVLSDHYTEEKILIENKEIRMIPWSDADTTFIYIFGGCSNYFQKK